MQIVMLHMQIDTVKAVGLEDHTLISLFVYFHKKLGLS